MVEKTKSFWSSLPGILTGLAAVITALTGLYHVVYGGKTSVADGLKNGRQVEQGAMPSSPSGPGTVEGATSTATTPLKPLARPPEVIPKAQDEAPFAESGALVDCSLFPTVNKVGTLMNWSNYYHKQIVDAGDVKRRATEPCNKTIDYRSMAHCEVPDDLEIRKELLETLTLCRGVGIEWRDIQRFQ